MPLEIKELHIKAVVGNGNNQQGANAGSGGSEEDKQAIIAEAVEKVLQILEDKKKR